MTRPSIVCVSLFSLNLIEKNKINNTNLVYDTIRIYTKIFLDKGVCPDDLCVHHLCSACVSNGIIQNRFLLSKKGFIPYSF